jgi:hypothetical protein
MKVRTHLKLPYLTISMLDFGVRFQYVWIKSPLCGDELKTYFMQSFKKLSNVPTINIKSAHFIQYHKCFVYIPHTLHLGQYFMHDLNSPELFSCWFSSLKSWTQR